MAYLGPPRLAWGEGLVLEEGLVDLVLILEAAACLEGRLVDSLEEEEVLGQQQEVGGCSDRPPPPNRVESWGVEPPVGGCLEGADWQAEGLQGADSFRPLKVSPLVA